MTINNFSTNAATANNHMNASKQHGDKALQNVAALRALSGTDGSNLAIADSLLSQSNTMQQGIANANDAIGMLQIADSTLANLSQSADRISELSVSLGNAALGSSERKMIQSEITALKNSMTQSVSQASFNGKNVFSGELNFVTGNSVANINLSANAVTAIKEDGSNAGDIISRISSLRGEIGSVQNGIQSGINTSIAQEVALRESESKLQNNDVAKNLSEYKQDNLKLNAAVLAHAHNTENLRLQMDRLLA